MAVPEPMLTEFGIHYRLESCGWEYHQILQIAALLHEISLTNSSSSDMAASASASFFLWNQVRLLTEETPGFKAVRRASSSDSCDTSNTLIRPSAPPVANRSGLVGWNFTKVIRYTYSGGGAWFFASSSHSEGKRDDCRSRSSICRNGH